LVIAESLDNNEPLYAAFIDASKAFDVVWHESMLRKLFYTGISKETWILTKMLYQDLHSKVKWEGKGVIIPDLKHFGTVPSLNIFSKIDFNKYTRDGPPNLKCSADNNCSSWDLPFFISHTNLSYD
jgi:hypothetical protein